MADGHTPTGGMKAAARRALQWKKEGKRGGTRVGLTRANQIVNGTALSDSTVMRMFSFFSRHEVDKKATGFNSGEEGFPSPGRVAWDLWGGDAGFSWSRQKAASIKNKRMNKMSSVWDGAFLGQLGKDQTAVEAAEEALLDIEEQNDEPLDPVEVPAEPETAPVVEETPAESNVVTSEDVASEPEPVVENTENEAPAVAEEVKEAEPTTEPTE